MRSATFLWAGRISRVAARQLEEEISRSRGTEGLLKRAFCGSASSPGTVFASWTSSTNVPMPEGITGLAMAREYRYGVLFQSDAMFVLYRYNFCLLASLLSDRVCGKAR